MAGLPIPTDWDEQADGYCVISFTVPNSPRWRAHVRGSVHALTKEFTWDEETGDVEQVIATAKDIWDSYEISCT